MKLTVFLLTGSEIARPITARVAIVTIKARQLMSSPFNSDMVIEGIMANASTIKMRPI